MSRTCLLIAIALVGVAAASLSADDAIDEDFFERSIRPLLAEHCWNCHGAQKQWSSLRLDSREAMLQGGESGPAIEVNQPADSLILQAVIGHGDLQRMPPDYPLSDQQVALLKRWIESGSPWPQPPTPKANDAWKSHWAFQPIIATLPPAADNNSWINNPIDQYVWQQLHAQGMQPAPSADRATLIRRVTYSLTGLPPTYDQVEAFVRDPNPDAYERLVDNLLDSPRYGEHLARMWLDLARYSDTKGYVYGREERFFVHAALYRDWVIQAFNSDMPYDQFLKLQIAADQISPDRPDNLVAMGFLTLGRRFLGVTHDIIDDRIDVVGRGTMALTLSCARCHDHKYDPIPTADYYSLYGVFQNSTDRQVDLTSHLQPSPSVEFLEELKKRQQTLREATSQSRLAAATRVRGRLSDYLFAQTELHKYGQEGFDVILATDDLIPAFVRRWENFLSSRDPANDQVFAPWWRISRLSAEDWIRQAEATVEQCQSIPLHPWIAALLDPMPGDLRQLADRYGQLFQSVDDRWQEIKARPEAKHSDDDRQWLASAQPLLDILYGPAAPCEVPDEEIIATETYFDSATCTQLWKLQGEVDRWRLQSGQAPQVAVAVFDRSVTIEPRIFRRGNPANKGPAVPRHFLSMFSTEQPQAFQLGSGRLELAQHIASSNNPLTPRVWVNRLWQHHFGQGLVPTPSDFGLRASPPSHPELLDWLSSQLVEQQWSTKAIQRLILLSTTYRQSSEQSTAGLQQRFSEIDPDNRWLWRMNPRRLTFEETRDTLLQASQDLQHRLGGKAEELFSSGDSNHRRTVYGLVDRQFLPATLRIFDFANPDLHVGRRSETLVPQQSLYFLNHPFIAQRARSLIDKQEVAESDTNAGDAVLLEFISNLYRAILNRDPRSGECDAALAFLKQAELPEKPLHESARAWSYGFGEIDQLTGKTKAFQPLPHFTGSAWQGGNNLPDGQLGWVQVTATGGHPGNDLQHAAIRRWTAESDMRISISSTARHEPDLSDGVRFSILSSRQGRLAEVCLKAATQQIDVADLEVKAGDTVDFVVDLLQELNSDQFLWSIAVAQSPAALSRSLSPAEQRAPSPDRSDQPDVKQKRWNAERDFMGPNPSQLSRTQQLAQVLMLTNELSYVD